MTDTPANDHWCGIREISAAIVLSLTIAGMCHYCYFLLAPWIWNQNIPFKPEDLTPLVLEAAEEHDGVEIYALYTMVFISSFTALFSYHVVGNIPVKYARRTVLALCAIVSCGYCLAIGFTPPMNNVSVLSLMTIAQKSLPLILIGAVFLALMFFLQQRLPRSVPLIAAVLLAPVCFIATAPISRFDYSFIFSPALRLLNGAAIRDIYFQYDLLPSLLAAVWMKLGFDLNRFQILGQTAYYGVIFYVFMFSRRLFQRKELSIVLLSALVLIRIYASPWDVVYCFQVTPLRLDLWLPLLAVVYRRGPYHWSAGLVCGLLILLLKNFGIIYSLAYIQLLITMSALSLFDNENGTPFLSTLAGCGKKCVRPVAIILGACALSVIFSNNAEFPNYSGYYQKLGIGFIQISSTSFYWYIPAMISIVFILLFRLRSLVSYRYFICGLLLTFCAIGNSIYFFGRSHEHNILNISIVLMFLFFFMLDLISRFLQKDSSDNRFFSMLQRHVDVCIATVIVLAVIAYYAGTISAKGSQQIARISKGQMIFPLDVNEKDFRPFLSRVRRVTGDSSKVYFVGGPDFEFYYYGGYAPVGYCNPFSTWIFTKELTRFLQGLLDSGYYLVCDGTMKHLLPRLQFSNATAIGTQVVITKLPGQVPRL